MKDKLKAPETSIDRLETNGSPVIGQAEPMAWDSSARCRWPSRFKPSEASPLEWWRKLSPDALHDAERLLLLSTLKRVRLLHADTDLTAALHGDPAAAISAALGLMPVMEITLQTDITMTALMCTALDSNSTSSLVMAQILGLSDVGDPPAAELAEAWLAYGQWHSSDRSKFSEARTVLLAAFRDCRSRREDA
jgi:hypothetical protein